MRIDVGNLGLSVDDKPRVNLADSPSTVDISIEEQFGERLGMTLKKAHIEKLKNHLDDLLRQW